MERPEPPTPAAPSSSDAEPTGLLQSLPDPDRRYFFVHLQKTAGTSLILRLRERLAPPLVYPNPSDGPVVDSVLSVDHLLARWEARHDEIRIVTGHFPLCTADLLGEGFTTLTVLRDPVERTLSYLRHHRRETPADADKSLEEIYDDPFRFDTLIHNHMVKMLSLEVGEMTDGALTHVEFTPERLARAKERLAAVDIVGLQERYPEFWIHVRRAFKWPLGRPAHANRTQATEVPESFRRRIAADNADDIALYEYARDELLGPPERMRR
jgi:hypothetical protein